MSSDEEEGPLQYEVHHSHNGNVTPKHYVIGCKSNHDNFVPVKNFTVENLPKELHNIYLFNLIILNINLTVMVHVTCSNTKSNEKIEKHGSGSVCYFSDTHNIFPCNHGDINECQFCHIPNCPYIETFGNDHFMVSNYGSSLLSENQHKRAHLAFRVSTNQHVVRDAEEAQRTNVQLFYHNEDNKDTVIAKVVCICETWEEQDKVHLVCVTDMNERVKNLLESMRCDFHALFSSIPSDIMNKFIKNYVVVLSHPHGWEKVVSVGKKINSKRKRIKNGPWYVETRYQVETCLGCSGAPVIGPGWEDGGPVYRVHCGYVELTKSMKKVCVSKSHWVMNSDIRGGVISPVSETTNDS